MKLRKTITILAVGALAVAAVFGVAIYRNVFAQAPTLTASLNNRIPGQGFGKGPMGGFTDEDLASALGITVDELNAARQKAQTAAIDQAVSEGLITQAQADQLKVNGMAFPFGGRWGEWMSQNGIDFDSLLADALGIKVEALQAARIQAFNARIDQEVANGRLTQEQADLMKGRNALQSNANFRSAMQSSYEAAVNQAVAEGVITQAQADLILKDGQGMGFPGFGGPPEGGFGRHGWGDGHPNLPPNQLSPEATPSSGF
jgi:hypothetical protein